tara:strand:- start:24285 stop:25478 length:1194 start_codon:yes stop_codon:yes gene_type:complete
MSDDSRLLDFCVSDTQRQVVKALIEHQGNRSKAASALGITERNIYRTLSRVKTHAALQGYSPDHGLTHEAAPGFSVKGVSTLYNADGEQRAQWVKTTAQAQREDELRDAILDTFSEWKGKGKVGSPPNHLNEDLLTVYPMGDPHIGMYAFAEETGTNFDLKIAEDNLCEAVDRLVSCAPKSKTALILNLGDFFHADTMDNKTRRSGVSLDVDTRWSKVLRVGVRAMLRCIESASKRHEKVIVKNLIGNHDDHSSQMLSLALSLFYDKSSRIIVEDQPAKFWFHRFGNVLIGAGHGDTAKPNALPGIMATDRAEDWGSTTHRYWYTGHIHNQQVIEFPGVIWESFRTLAGKDAWHAAQGYRSGRDMYAIVHSKDFGEIERHRVDISMLHNGITPSRAS